MEEQKNINIINEAFRLLWLENKAKANNEVSSNELEAIIQGSYKTSMCQEKKALLQEKLFSKISSSSLGQLVSESMQRNSVTDEAIAAQCKLPFNIVEEIKSDSIFPNNVPIMLLKNFLHSLGIQFQTAEKAIWKTFEVIKNRNLFSQQGSIYSQPAFRHNQNNSQNSIMKSVNPSDGRELFENETSLKKYLNKLESLMNS